MDSRTWPRRRLPCLVWILLAACSPRADTQGLDAVDRAAGRMVDGDTLGAVRALERIASGRGPAEVRREALWHLALAEAAAGHYARAFDAIVAGRALGGGAPFDALEADVRARAAADPAWAARAPVLTRGALAGLLARVVPGAADPTPAGPAAAWRLVGVPADGRRHDGTPVTRAAFHAVLCRVVARTGAPGSAGDYLPGGVRWVAAAPREPVGGAEALDVLRRVAAALRGAGGRRDRGPAAGGGRGGR